MADLTVLQRGYEKEVQVGQVIFRDKEDSSHGYIFETDENMVLTFKTHKMERNYVNCMIAFEEDKMTMENKIVIKKIKMPTVALCQCDHLIEMGSGITVCPHCRSIYDRKGREVFF